MEDDFEKEHREFAEWLKNNMLYVHPINCPDCGSTKISCVPGGTCYYPQKGINWLCQECLNEW